MKISNSKKELARIISENGGWRDGNYAIQDKDDLRVWFTHKVEGKPCGNPYWPCHKSHAINHNSLLPNWHQTILSREDYFHLYPELDEKPKFCESVMRSIPEPSSKPTIEQLASDYRNAKDYAERRQQEANAARADADAKLKALELAGEALGLLVKPITAKQESELVIADWRDLRVGDVIRCVGDWQDEDTHGMIFSVDEIESPEYQYELAIRVVLEDGTGVWGKDFEFIRRP